MPRASAWVSVLLCLTSLFGCATASVHVVSPLTTDVSGSSASLRVTAREGLVEFLNPRERARGKVTRILREQLDGAGTFRIIVPPQQGQLDLWVEVTGYEKPKGHAEDAVCELEVRLIDRSKNQTLTHFTAVGRAAHPASKAEWWKSEERAVQDAVRRVVDYLGSVRIAG